MGRPRTAIGTFGEFTYLAAPNGKIKARVRFRDDDGQLRLVQASGDTRKAAERALKQKLTRRDNYSAGHGDLSADSTFSRLVEVWLADLDLMGKLAPSTRALYERNMRQLVLPAFENYTLREITVRTVGDSAGREVSVRLELLDRQLVDADDLPVGRVDDLDLDLDLGPASSSDAPPELSSMGEQERTVVALLVGQRHLGSRVGGITGALLTRSAQRLSHDPSGERVEPADVATWSDLVKLRRRLDDLDLAPLEKWLSARLVRRIPGGDDEGI